MSDRYFVNFFYQITEIVASKVFGGLDQSEGTSATAEMLIKEVYDLTCGWPIVEPGTPYELNMFGYLLQVDVPSDFLENVSYLHKVARVKYS